MIRVHESAFLVSAAAPAGYPPDVGFEVAFAGRSNVGKSSLINALTGRRKLTRVSRTPGRTRLLNFFTVKLLDGETRRTVRLCDLPGYGYAKVSKAERAGWQLMIEGYLAKRTALRAVVLIVDGEVGVTPVDAQVLTWLREHGRQVIVTATKMDRMSKAHRIPALRAVEKALGEKSGSVVPVSSVDSLGLDTLWARLVSFSNSESAGV